MQTNNLGYPRIGSNREFMKCFLTFTALFMAQSFSYGQIISTVAGNGTYGTTGNGGQATLAEEENAEIVAVDASGNFYISGDGSHTVRKVKVSTGVITVVAGNGTSGNTGDGGAATAAELDYPQGVAIDASGNIYIADFYNANIRKVNGSTGIITTIAGNGTSGYNGDGGPATAAELYYPFGVAVDASGNVYIGDLKNNRIRKITASTGIITTVAGNGTLGYSGDGEQATAAEINYPQIVILDASGNIYIADQENNRVRKVTVSTGIITTIAGNGIGGYAGDGGQATAAELSYPTGLAFDGSGNLYIGDQNNKRVRKLTAFTGIITTIAGTGTSGYSGDGGAATAAKLSFIDGVAVDKFGNIYIGDTGNNRIRKITDGASPLPITLTSFDVTYAEQTNSILINWEVAAQLNNKNFVIQKTLDGINYMQVDTIPGAGNAPFIKSYSATDNYPIPGISYYRLEQIDIDGNSTYFPPTSIFVENIQSDSIQLFPNPNKGVFVVTLSHVSASRTIKIYNTIGEQVYNAILNQVEGKNVIDISNQAAGIYFYGIFSASGILIEKGKIMIER